MEGAATRQWPQHQRLGDFAFGSLFERARTGSRHGRLHERDLAVFEEFATANFEVVLGNLDTATRTLDALGYETDFMVEHYASVQAALGAAVRAVHITRSDAPELTLETIKSVLQQQKATFTTSYDLLVYWAMGYPLDYGSLVDPFWSDSPHGGCEFQRGQHHRVRRIQAGVLPSRRPSSRPDRRKNQPQAGVD